MNNQYSSSLSGTPNRDRASTKIYSFLDTPVHKSCFVRFVSVKGWAFSIEGRPLYIELYINNDYFCNITIEDRRPDVKKAFEDLCADDICGFDKIIYWNDLKQFGTQIHIELRISCGNNCISVLGPVLVEKVDIIPVSQIRTNYRDVWNSLSATEQAATHAVSCFTDNKRMADAGRESVETFNRLVGIRKTDVILEIGCGVGRVGRFLAPLCKKWIGTDVSENMLAYAEKTLLKEYDNIELVHTNGYDLSEIGDNSVDFVYCHIVFMHLEEVDRFIYVQEAYRVLRPGGRVYIDNINLCGSEGWKKFLSLSRIDPAGRPSHQGKASTPEELNVYLEKSGFTNIEIVSDALVVYGIGHKPE